MPSVHSQRHWRGLLALALVVSSFSALVGTVRAAGTISLTMLGSAYNQDFDTLASSSTSSTLPTGWDFLETGTNANTIYTAGTGSGNTGDTYSFGAAANSERAFGGLQSGSLNPTVGASFTNDTGGTITDLVISYTGEQWRLGTAGRTDRIDFQISTTATALNTGTWTDNNSLDFNGPISSGTIGALNGNTAANRSAVSATISGLSIANGATFWIRWVSFDATGADDGLAIDDFSLIPMGVAADSAPSVSSTSPSGGASGVLLTDNISVTFSEAVNAPAAAFNLNCNLSGAHTVAVSGGPTTFTLNPAPDFANGETCTLTIDAASISDQDTNDPPDTMENNYITSFSTIGPDLAPEVASTIPADGATNVPLNQNVIVNFSEPVTVTDPWFSLTCATSGAHPATVTGGPTSFTLNPSSDFVFGEACTLIIDANNVSDQDNNDPPDTMVLNFTAGFTTEPDPCTLAFEPIYNIQGSGPSAALTGSRTTQGVVVADYEYPGSGSTAAFLRGFYIQDLNGDANAATSDAIFVFNGNNNSVALGDIVRVSGTVSEFQDQTQISASSIRLCGTGSVGPVDVNLPFVSATAAEAYEGMLVRLPQTLYVSEHFQLGRFGQVVLSAGNRLTQPTNVVAPGAVANALQAQNNLNRIILDDASQGQNPDPILFGRNGNPLSASNTLRGGDTATGIVGVMTYTWAGNAASGNAYRVRPINALGGNANFVAANPRPSAAPVVGGTVRVVGMNLLNFFNTFADSNAATPGCFPSGTDADCRGANSASEFARQYPKTVAAILAMNPDIVGVNELENDGYGSASSLQFLVDQLNTATAPGTYAFINVDANTGQTNAMGTDAIRVAQIYKPGVVTPVGQTAVLNSIAFVNGGDPAPRSRPSLAQAYQVNATGAVFIVDVNHLKSKGSACAAPDAGDGQGNCNIVRTNSATELVNWLAGYPTGIADPDVLIIGDLNSYAKEDPISVIQNAGFTNLIEAFLGPDAYSYVFDGQWGYLDHALGSATIVGQINGVGDYHINADEPAVLDYNTEFKTAGLIASLYAPDQFRISDHDPVMIGLTPNAPPIVDAGGAYSVTEGGSVTLSATGSDPNLGDVLTYAWDLDNNGSFETAGQSVSFSAALLDGPTSAIVQVQVTDALGLQATDEAEITVTNVAPMVNASFNAATGVSCGANNATLTVSFSDPGIADTHDAVITWGDGTSQTISAVSSPLSVPHTYASAGVYNASVNISDDDGDTGNSTATVAVNYTVVGDGVLQPINQDGTSVFKYNSTIPVKVRLANCDGSTPSNLAPTIKLTLISGSTPSLEINEPISTSAADTNGIMRYSSQQYIYNLATKPLPDPTATYRVTITVPSTGQKITAQFGLR
jgi:uncharacterized protein